MTENFTLCSIQGQNWDIDSSIDFHMYYLYDTPFHVSKFDRNIENRCIFTFLDKMPIKGTHGPIPLALCQIYFSILHFLRG
jgi:hypothetical protein